MPLACRSSLFVLLGLLIALTWPLRAATPDTLSLLPTIVVETAPPAGAFTVFDSDHIAPILTDPGDHAGVLRAAADLQADIRRVGDRAPAIEHAAAPGSRPILVGTLGRSALIDRLVAEGKLDASDLAGKWESFVITVVSEPTPDLPQALVIAGSDKRGTIYGIYELCEQLGVSPWYWWADVPAKKRPAAHVIPGRFASGEPVVKYRGIFINNEEPAFGPWAREKFGGVNSKMYVHMFELLLRLRANYLWPAMWGKSFNEDDPESPRLADEYGIVMGTSHHEPMMRAHKEWTDRRDRLANGEWNYATNEAVIADFFREGIRRNKDYDNLVTIGMRGDGDTAMADAGGMEANKRLLEKIMADQRRILAEELRTDPARVPQLWALFTEVQGIYDAGLKVPDDVTLLFCDDNVGNLRRLPTPEERLRSGGSGIYYHIDMNGGPYSYRWLNTFPLVKIQEQMNLAYHYGATRIWIVNVGDLKPMEIPIEFFVRMGWNPERYTKDDLVEYELRWATREFGPEHAAEIAHITSRYTKYNGWRKPELLKPDTFSLINYREAERVSAAWADVAARAERLRPLIPAEQQDAFYQLVYYPAVACANLVEFYIAVGRNALFARQGRASAHAEAARARELFRRDAALAERYNHDVAGGKWNHMMDEHYIGYTDWRPPGRKIMPPLVEPTLPDTDDFGVAIDGSASAWPGADGAPELPVFDSLAPRPSHIEVFARGTRPPSFRARADQPWILLTEEPAPGAGSDRRIQVNIDWSRVPAGENRGAVTIEGKQTVTVSLTALKATEAQVREAAGAFGGLAGPIAIAAIDAVRKIPADGVRWELLPDFGRGRGAMTPFPVTAASTPPPQPAPLLEYPVYFARAGRYKVRLETNPTLNLIPSRGLHAAVGLDDQPPQVVNVFAPETRKDEDFVGRRYNINTRDGIRTMNFEIEVPSPGRHTLKLPMIDPTLVVSKITLHDQPLPDSYFGPPETPPHPAADRPLPHRRR